MEDRACIPVGPPVNKPLPSYWQDPKSPLANVIEPEVDTTTIPYDYAIIGSGISGTMIAYNILKKSPDSRVVMVEAREICSGATGRNGGHTKAASYRSYLQHVQELGRDEALKIARLEYANIVETHELAEELGIECESHLCNTVDLIYDTATFEQGKLAIQTLRADSTAEEREDGEMAQYAVHDKSSALKSFPISSSNDNPSITSPEELAGAFSYLAGRIHAYLFTTGVLKSLVQKGLQLCANTPVHAILPSPRTTTTTTTTTTTNNNNKPLWDIFTQHNTLTASTLILATNGYTPYLLKQTQTSIVPLRGQITVQQPPHTTTLPFPLPTTYSFIYKTGYEYMIPRPLKDASQHLIIGGGLGRLPSAGAAEYGTVDDSQLNPVVSRYLYHTLPSYFSGKTWGSSSSPSYPPSPNNSVVDIHTNGDNAVEKRIVQEWTGIMGATADGRPFVGQVPAQEGLWMSAGFNGHGMVLCLKSAEALVEMMMTTTATTTGGRMPEWFPESFLVTEGRLGMGGFRGRRDMQGLT